MQFYWERMKLVVEPSGAVPLAGLLSDEFDNSMMKKKKVGVLISGGNIDLSDFFAQLRS